MPISQRFQLSTELISLEDTPSMPTCEDRVSKWLQAIPRYNTPTNIMRTRPPVGPCWCRPEQVHTIQAKSEAQKAGRFLRLLALQACSLPCRSRQQFLRPTQSHRHEQKRRAKIWIDTLDADASAGRPEKSCFLICSSLSASGAKLRRCVLPRVPCSALVGPSHGTGFTGTCFRRGKAPQEHKQDRAKEGESITRGSSAGCSSRPAYQDGNVMNASPKPGHQASRTSAVSCFGWCGLTSVCEEYPSITLIRQSHASAASFLSGGR